MKKTNTILSTVKLIFGAALIIISQSLSAQQTQEEKAAEVIKMMQQQMGNQSAKEAEGNAYLEKMMAKKAAERKVEIVGDEGMVYVYASAARNKKITSITGLTKIYCTAYIHKKKFNQVSPSNTSVSYSLYSGSNCNLNDGRGEACSKYYDAESIEALSSDNRGHYKLKLEKFDFEIDLVAATEEDVKRNSIPKEKDFFVVINIKSTFLATSSKLTFDIAAGAESYAQNEIEKNKDLALKTPAFKDASLEQSVRRLMKQRGWTEVKRVSFYSNWTVKKNGAGTPLRRWCKLNISGKQDGKCKFFWCKVWEEYQGAGKYQLPNDLNESFNSMNRELVPCSNL